MLNFIFIIELYQTTRNLLMAGEALNFIEQLLSLDEIGQNIMVDSDFGKMQIARALYYHGKRHGKKYSYIKTSDGYLITYVANR